MAQVHFRQDERPRRGTSLLAQTPEATYTWFTRKRCSPTDQASGSRKSLLWVLVPQKSPPGVKTSQRYAATQGHDLACSGQTASQRWGGGVYIRLLQRQALTPPSLT